MPLYLPFDLRVEYLNEPPIIDIPRPRFFWKLRSDVRGDCQTAYQIIVPSERELCEKEIGDFWETAGIFKNTVTGSPG
jgi:alpha-L-rhamnosidase